MDCCGRPTTCRTGRYSRRRSSLPTGRWWRDERMRSQYLRFASRRPERAAPDLRASSASRSRSPWIGLRCPWDRSRCQPGRPTGRPRFRSTRQWWNSSRRSCRRARSTRTARTGVPCWCISGRLWQARSSSESWSSRACCRNARNGGLYDSRREGRKELAWSAAGTPPRLRAASQNSPCPPPLGAGCASEVWRRRFATPPPGSKPWHSLKLVLEEKGFRKSTCSIRFQRRCWTARFRAASWNGNTGGYSGILWHDKAIGDAILWYGMAWYGVVWYGMVCYGVVWYGMLWYAMVWYAMLCYAMLCYAMLCYGMVWYGMVWYGMVWYGMVWYGMVWYGMVWYGVVQLTIIRQSGGE